jgi:hypothetical protein
VLLWHFTDQFYHTDQDRIDKVSASTLKNVGIGAMAISLILTENKKRTPELLLSNLQLIAQARLREEAQLSKEAIHSGSTAEIETDILKTWSKYYEDVFSTLVDLEVQSSSKLKSMIEKAKNDLAQLTDDLLTSLK